MLCLQLWGFEPSSWGVGRAKGDGSRVRPEVSGPQVLRGPAGWRRPPGPGAAGLYALRIASGEDPSPGLRSPLSSRSLWLSNRPSTLAGTFQAGAVSSGIQAWEPETALGSNPMSAPSVSSSVALNEPLHLLSHRVLICLMRDRVYLSCRYP